MSRSVGWLLMALLSAACAFGHGFDPDGVAEEVSWADSADSAIGDLGEDDDDDLIDLLALDQEQSRVK